MGSYEDDRYYREQERRREEQREYYRRQDDLREQRDRDFYREQDRRRDDFMEDQEYERRRREEDRARGYEAMRRGDTAEALRNLIGPDAAVDYLARTADLGDSSRRMVPHSFVDDLSGMEENLIAAAAGTSSVAVRLDDDGDAVIHVRRGDDIVDIFWVRAPFVSRLAPSEGATGESAALIRQIISLRDGRGVDSIDRPEAGARSTEELGLPYAFVGDMDQLLAVARAAPFARFEAGTIDPDGDLPVIARFAGRSSTFWVRAPFLDAVGAGAEVPFGEWTARALLDEIVRGGDRPSRA